MQTTFNPAVNAALNNIRQSLAHQQRVSFVYHCWQPFSNLSLNGFRFRQVPEKEIPRLSLIPVVAMQDDMVSSKMSQLVNRHVPVFIPHQVSIEASITDLAMKFAGFGLVTLTPLETTIDNLEESVSIFEIITRGIELSTPLELFTEYFDMDSPVEYQFTSKRKLLKKDAKYYLAEALNDGELNESQVAKAQAAIALLGESARIAHVVALDPNDGVLPKTIKAISDRLKFKFDPVDEWLTRQFPSFDARGSLGAAQKESSNDVLEKLVELLAARQAPVPDQAPTNAVSIGAFSESPEVEVAEAIVEEIPVEERPSCQATLKSGKQCPRRSLEGSEFCHFHGGSSK